MAKKKSSGGPSGAFFIIVILLILGIGAGVWYSHKLMNAKQKPSTSQTTESAENSKPRRKVKIFVVEVKKDEVFLKPQVCSVPSDTEPHKAALDRLISTNREVSPSQHLIPLGTKVLDLKVEKGIAYADFSKELKDNFDGGSTSEELLVNSIVQTLTQFKDVKRVQILVEGKKVDSLGGHLDISEPIGPDLTVVDQGCSGE
jgi:germination protein M